MKKNNTYLVMRKALALSAIFFLIGLYACKKDGKLTPDFDDGGLSINKIDTITIRTQVVQEDSIRSDLSVFNLLGLYHDPIFGPVSSSIYTQITLTGVNVDLDSPTSSLDSIVLTLDYESFYGDTATPMTINVYQLNNTLSTSNDYYSNSYTPFDPTILASKTFVPNLKDSIYVLFDSINKAPHLRLKLSNTFGQTIMNADADGGNQMVDNATFTNFMKGLYITTADSAGNTSLLASQGSIASFDMNSSLSTLTLYYNDSLKYDFTINSSGVTYCRFQHNYTGTDIEAQLNNSSTKDTTVAYIATMARVKTKLEFPYITNLAEVSGLIVNKAELEVTLENGTEGSFDEPLSKISLVGIDANGNDIFLPDFFEGEDYFGGSYDENTKTYTFNITRHVNDLIHGNIGNYGMYLVANGKSVSANRSVIGSEKNTTAKIKLNITYSKL